MTVEAHASVFDSAFVLRVRTLGVFLYCIAMLLYCPEYSVLVVVRIFQLTHNRDKNKNDGLAINPRGIRASPG